MRRLRCSRRKRRRPICGSPEAPPFGRHTQVPQRHPSAGRGLTGRVRGMPACAGMTVGGGEGSRLLSSPQRRLGSRRLSARDASLRWHDGKSAHPVRNGARVQTPSPFGLSLSKARPSLFAKVRSTCAATRSTIPMQKYRASTGSARAESGAIMSEQRSCLPPPPTPQERPGRR
jgi:hypothetical protein